VSAAPLLKLDDIQLAYGDVQVLNGISLDVYPGEIVTLLGSNGAGKTTTLRAIAGLRPTRGGNIQYEGEALLLRPASHRAKMGIALVPEGRELWGQLTVQENLELGAYSKNARPKAAASLERVFALFPRLKERRRQLAGSLSGGEQQMCAIGRALMIEPKLLMLDEPSLGLAPIIVEQVFQVIRQLHSTGITILLVEQNLKMALEVADRGYVVETGKIKIAGSSAELSSNEAIRSAYLGL
jgi:branched-chain amino acid transport system ATP-binding protein